MAFLLSYFSRLLLQDLDVGFSCDPLKCYASNGLQSAMKQNWRVSRQNHVSASEVEAAVKGLSSLEAGGTDRKKHRSSTLISMIL
jgi:hypothetical protein